LLKIYTSVEINSELVKSLSVFGLPDKSAKLYLILLKYGPKTLNELIKLTDSYRQDVQRSMEQLSDSGLIEISLAKPTTYTAVPIKTALNAVILKQQAGTRAMEELIPKLIDQIHAFIVTEKPIPDDVSRFKVIKRRREIYSIMRELIQSAQHEVAIVNTANGFYRFSRFEIMDDAIAMAQRGVEVRAIVTTDAPYVDEFQCAEAGGVQIRQYNKYVGVRFLVVDRRQTITPISSRDEAFALDVDDSAFWTNEREYAEQLMATFEMLWPEATEISKSLVEVITEEELPPSRKADEEKNSGTKT
jgi:sugar-specific transcriptional regulator TrmB